MCVSRRESESTTRGGESGGPLPLPDSTTTRRLKMCSVHVLVVVVRTQDFIIEEKRPSELAGGVVFCERERRYKLLSATTRLRLGVEHYSMCAMR